MLRTLRPQLTYLVFVASLVIMLTGCTSFSEYVRNGFKVGPNYCPVAAPVANNWIDADDIRIRSQSDDISQWWTVFNDPVLNNLIACAYRQNLTVKQAAFRVLQARYKLAIAKGGFFPQSQTGSGSFTRAGSTAGGFADVWDFGFNLQWELDFWGRLRRAIQAADDQLGLSVADYDDVMVTLLSDVASNYVQIRTDQERIKLLSENVKVQRDVLELVKTKVNIGIVVTDLDAEQAESTLKQTEAAIPLLLIDMRQANDQLCTLLGIPPADLMKLIGNAPIPTAPPEVAIGIPCEMLSRRPDIRRAERAAAAQAEQIGIAETDLYPIFSISGTMGWTANNFSELFNTQAFNGSVGPSFNWKLLNYGRIVNNVRFQDAGFQELIAAYQNTVLQANQEVEDGLVTFLQSQERTKILYESMKAGEVARGIALRLYGKTTGFDFNRYAVIEQNLISQQDAWAQSRGQIAQGLISVYRALGGGWQIRFNPPPVTPLGMPGAMPPEAQPSGAPAPGVQPTPEELPKPIPTPPGPQQ
jgi:NodT family efflux transporter outer membrane factor (OMF) lipoprotein